MSKQPAYWNTAGTFGHDVLCPCEKTYKNSVTAVIRAASAAALRQESCAAGRRRRSTWPPCTRAWLPPATWGRARRLRRRPRRAMPARRRRRCWPMAARDCAITYSSHWVLNTRSGTLREVAARTQRRGQGIAGNFVWKCRPKLKNVLFVAVRAGGAFRAVVRAIYDH